MIPWGILCGSLGLQMGLSPWQSQAMSLLVFAGAAQLSGVTMIGAATGLTALFSSTFVISARHMLYSASLRVHILPLPLHWRLSLGFLLTDEMYALSHAHTQKHGNFDPHYALFSGATFYIFWNIATFIGVYAGTHLAGIEEFGLDFAIAATFIALTIPNIKDKPTLACVLVSGITMIAFQYFGMAQAIIAATFCGMLTGFLLEGQQNSADKQKKRPVRSDKDSDTDSDTESEMPGEGRT